MRAFSLVELSIVLVILGLLTGGILAGQSLIRSAAMRATIQQYQQYRTAIYTFRDKYTAFPGDMPNATSFWGAADSGNGLGTDCYSVASANSATCNGSGDGFIGKPADIAWGTLYEGAEEFRFWQQLANAGLIEGRYTGVTDSTTSGYAGTVGLNTPGSKLDSTSAVRCTEAKSTQYFPGIAGTTILGMTGANTLTPTENYNIDIKLDDGKPAYGKVQVPLPTMSWALDCATSASAATAEYNLSSPDKRCLFAATCQQ